MGRILSSLSWCLVRDRLLRRFNCEEFVDTRLCWRSGGHYSGEIPCDPSELKSLTAGRYIEDIVFMCVVPCDLFVGYDFILMHAARVVVLEFLSELKLQYSNKINNRKRNFYLCQK